MNHQKKEYFLNLITLMTLLSSVSLAANTNCVTKQNLTALEADMLAMHQAIESDNLKHVSSFMHFPITDNHNHVITKRVFLQEQDYEPVINVKKLFKEDFPSTMHATGIKSYQYLDECNKYVVENSVAKQGHGLRFIFKKIGNVLKLKLISFVK